MVEIESLRGKIRFINMDMYFVTFHGWTELRGIGLLHIIYMTAELVDRPKMSTSECGEWSLKWSTNTLLRTVVLYRPSSNQTSVTEFISEFDDSRTELTMIKEVCYYGRH